MESTHPLKITVVGAGSWGTTLALVLNNNRHQVRLWTYKADHAEELERFRENKSFLPRIPIPKDIEISNDLRSACDGRNMIVAAVPAQFLRSVVEQIANLDLTHTVICNVAKGIETNTLMTMSQVLLDVLEHERKENVAILSGPSHAEEVSIEVPTAVVASSFKLKTSRFVQNAFMTPYFRVYVNEDIRGVELGGALKNVIAIGAGISDGANFGDNTKAAIMTRGIYEISKLGVIMGAKPSTFAGLSGVGDLIVTCMSKHSRNRFVGEEVGKGKKLENVLNEMVMVAEGVPTAKSAHRLAIKHSVEIPIINEVYKVLFEGKNPKMAVQEWMTGHDRDE